jgi:hypothetical protein
MKTEIINGMTIITADEGNVLVSTSGIYSKCFLLGKNDVSENYDEIDEASLPIEDENVEL